MTEQQLQKWQLIRQQGRTKYLIKRMLLWGSLLAILNTAYFIFALLFIVEPVASSLVPGKHTLSDEFIFRFIYDLCERGLACFLMVGVIFFAVWTSNERSYYKAMQKLGEEHLNVMRSGN